MEKKNWAKTLLLISWLGIFPLSYLGILAIQQEMYDSFYRPRNYGSDFTSLSSLSAGGLISGLLNIYVINSSVVFLSLLIYSLIKLRCYRSDVERKIIYKKKSVRYSILLGVTFFVWAISKLIGTVFGIQIYNLEKPIIYLYPAEKVDVNVKVYPTNGIRFSYPKYVDGWTVTAESNGQLTTFDGSEYSSLFWEAKSKYNNYDLTTGFVVKGEDTISFLRNKLAEIGLKPKEYNDMITYWLPKMEENKYNLIHFATKEEYDQQNLLEVKPNPDSILRVFMVFKPLNKEVKVLPQKFEKFERKGFAVVEWGGTELK